MQNLLKVFSSLCAVSCRLSLDDIPAKERFQFIISLTLTWAVLHNRKKPKIVPTWDWGALKDDNKGQLTARGDFLLSVYFSDYKSGKVLASFLMRCENWWYSLEKKPLWWVVLLKSWVLQITLASLWQVDCLMLFALAFTRLCIRQNQAGPEGRGRFRLLSQPQVLSGFLDLVHENGDLKKA